MLTTTDLPGEPVDGGVLAVVGQRKVRGAVERSYRLDVGAATLMADFERYLARSGGCPVLARDRIGYRPVAVWVTGEEFD